MSLSYDAAKALLDKNGQGHVLKFWDRLNEDQRSSLLSQVSSLNFDSISYMREMLVKSASNQAGAGEIAPSPVMTLKEFTGSIYREAKIEGEKALRAGETGVILVAGGQGSRLGYEGPKGCYNLAPISNACLFEIHAHKILALEQRHGTEIPFYIMTSQLNDQPTKDFFKQNNYFGLSPERVKFFAQGMWPALSEKGEILLEEPGRIFMGPDGHGGILDALKVNGMLKDMKKRGIETLFYFQVDNPLVEIADPLFIGLHRLKKCDMSIKVCAKRDPEEGLGVVVQKSGRNMVVEYTELTKEQKHATVPGGDLKFKFGSVAIHVCSRRFLEKESNARMPLHIAHKKVQCCDNDGNIVKPEKPNGYKFEKFIFDIVPDAERIVNLEFLREDEFSPVKNKDGNDSPDMSRRDIVRKFARWFKQAGVDVPTGENGEPKYKIEIDPCYALDAEELKEKTGKDFKINGDILLK